MMDFISKINVILKKVDEPQLTDQEIETIKPNDPESLQELYDTTYNIVVNRGSSNNTLDKIKADALIVNITIKKPKKNYSNVLFGFGLCQEL